MENASKALIIAGAILIAILLISIGMLIINSTHSLTDQVSSTSTSMEIQAFNSQFTSYCSDNVPASRVRDFIDIVIVNNSQYPGVPSNSNNSKSIYLNYYPNNYWKNRKGTVGHKYTTRGLQEIKKMIDDNATYTIYMTNCTSFSTSTGKGNHGYKNTGYVGCISISKNV